MANIQVEDISDVKKRVVFEISPEKVSDVIEAQYRDLKKTVQLKGFRRGKVPLNILRSYFKDKVEADAARAIIEETLEPGLEAQNITPVSVISIDPEPVKADGPFKYTAEIEVPPAIEVKNYKGLELRKYKRELSEEQVDERLENIRERHAKLMPLAEPRPLMEGDHIAADIKAEMDGEELAQLTVNDYHMELGRDFYLPDFDPNLIGKSADESHSFTMDLPDEFPRRDMAGKSADFQVTVKEVKERILPELDDDFARDLGEVKTLEELKENIREDIRRLLNNETKREIEDQILDALINENPFDVPESMVEKEAGRMLEESRRTLVNMGIDARDLPPPSQALQDDAQRTAERKVRGGLILKAIAESEGIEVSDEEFERGMEKRAQEMGFSVDHLKDLMKDSTLEIDLRSVLLQEKIFDAIKEQAEITEEELPPTEESQKEESVEE